MRKLTARAHAGTLLEQPACRSVRKDEVEVAAPGIEPTAPSLKASILTLEPQC